MAMANLYCLALVIEVNAQIYELNIRPEYN